MCHLKFCQPTPPALPPLRFADLDKAPSPAAFLPHQKVATPATNALAFFTGLGKRSTSPEPSDDEDVEILSPPLKKSASSEPSSPASPTPSIDSKVNHQLLEAARSGDAAAVKTCLAMEGCDPNFSDPRLCNSALHLAVFRSHVAVVIKLLAAPGINIDLPNNLGMTALLAAVECGQTAIVKLLLREGPDLAAVDRQGFTAVHKAVLNGNLEVLRLLLAQEGTPLNARSFEQKLSPLHQAAFHGKCDALELLLLRKADPNVLSDNLTSPLHMASLKNHVGAVKLLLQHGADAHCQDKLSRTALHYACLYGHVDAAEALCQNKASLSVVDYRDQSPLQLAARQGFEDVLHVLLRQFAQQSS